MPKLICTLPNASAVINGVAFVTHRLGMISEEVGQDAADHFLTVPGYQLADKRGQPAKQPDPPAAPEGGQTSMPLPTQPAGAVPGGDANPNPAAAEAAPGTD